MMTSDAHRSPFLVIVLLLLLLAAASGCDQAENRSDAYGNFEAVEVQVAAEAEGRLLRLSVQEGDRLQQGAPVALIDTTQLHLKREQLEANRRAIEARIPGLVAEMNVLEEQLTVARREKERILRLLEDDAATEKQLDDINGEIQVLQQKIESIRTRRPGIISEIEALDAQIAAVNDRIEKSIVTNPVSGTVLTAFAEPHELTSPGRPLYTIANLDTMILRAYVSGAQLPHIRLGQTVKVLVDESRTENRPLSGTVSWIASEAEFTPKTIQTKEDRVDLVYAFKVRVPNPDGRLKIGMPGEVQFNLHEP